MNPASPEIFILLPVMPPETKKSHFYEPLKSILKKEEFGLDRISLKNLKKECAENFAKANQKKIFTWEQLKMITEKDAEGLFRARLGKLIREAALSKKKAHFIYIERDHLPKMLPSALELIREYTEEINVKIVALVPELENPGIPYEARGKAYVNPFSLNFVFAGFDKALKKNREVMLNGVESKSTKAFLCFLNFFTNFTLGEHSFLFKGFDKVFYVPLVDEQSPSEIPEELVEALVNALKSCEPGRYNLNEDRLKELNQIYEELKVPFSYAQRPAIEDSILKFLEVEVYPEILTKVSQKTTAPEPEPSEPIVVQEHAKPAQKKLTKAQLKHLEKERKLVEKNGN